MELEKLTIGDLKALVVDDHFTERAHLKLLLKNMGCPVVDEAPTVNEAEFLATSKHYDIIFLDWTLPGKETGVDMLRRLRSDKTFDYTAFVMVTAKSEPDDIIMALRAGATSYIIKPASPEKIQENVTDVVEWIRQRRALQR
ncbi:MAG: response regulator [Alphaproteobacteria bacterium]